MIYSWRAIPQDTFVNANGNTEYRVHDASAPLIIGLDLGAGSVYDAELIQSVRFDISMTPNHLTDFTKVASVNKQPNIGGASGSNWRAFTIDVQEIVRAYLSHDLPAPLVNASLNTSYTIDSVTYDANPNLLTICTMNNVMVKVQPMGIALDPNTGLLEEQPPATDFNCTFRCVNAATNNDNVVGLDFNNDDPSGFSAGFGLGSTAFKQWMNDFHMSVIGNYEGNFSLLKQFQGRYTRKTLYGYLGIKPTSMGASQGDFFLYTFFDTSGSQLAAQYQIIAPCSDVNQFYEQQSDLRNIGQFFQLQVGLADLCKVNSNLKVQVEAGNVSLMAVYMVRVPVSGTASIGSLLFYDKIDVVRHKQLNGTMENGKALGEHHNLELVFLNKYGGMDSYKFYEGYGEKVKVKKDSIEKGIYNRRDRWKQGTNSYSGGVNHLDWFDASGVGETDSWEDEYANGNVYENAHEHLFDKFISPHNANRVVINTDVQVSYQISTGLIPKRDADFVKGLLTSPAVYIQRYKSQGSSTTTYYEPVSVTDGRWNIVDEENDGMVEIKLTLERQREYNTQQGG
tara:strand:- start:5158 stop:6858 length:1701 start_codon:yes stop_codon:yes gene_type:complete